VIEFARNVVGLKGANSSEFDEQSPHPVIDLMDDQRGVPTKGATMRLGAYDCVLRSESLASRIYQQTRISERHRHRYEVNNAYREPLAEKGLVFCGMSPDRSLVEMIELPAHPFYIACQFHPEFKSRPTEPHALFTHFVGAALARRGKN
jgi:CTP synthase